MPPLLPRESVRATSVIPALPNGLPLLSTGSTTPAKVYVATHGFTCVTACSFAVWKLTTPRCRNAAPSCYRGARTTPRTGLQPARLITVTANGQTTVLRGHIRPAAGLPDGPPASAWPHWPDTSEDGGYGRSCRRSGHTRRRGNAAMATQRRRAALLDGRHDLPLAQAELTLLCLPPGWPLGVEDIRNLQGGSRHACGRSLAASIAAIPGD